MNYQNPFVNPYGMVPQFPQGIQPAQQVVRVNGENGARAYTIGPNGSALLLDESGLMVWLITSDGAGYKTVSAYDITPHKTAQAPDYGSLEDRIRRLEEKVNGDTANTAAAGGRIKDTAADQADDQRGQISRKSAADDEPAYTNESANETNYGHSPGVRWGRR